MELLIYQAPDETLLFAPTAEQMEEIILRTDISYWKPGGNGEASIAVARRPDDKRRVSRTLVTRTGLRVEYVDGEPSLWIKQPIPGLYFITWSNKDGWVVPYDGTACDSIVLDERGGDPFEIPRACLVNGSQAVEIVREFLQTRGRSAEVPWCKWSELPLKPNERN